MDALSIKRAHIHGYSMGGGTTARLLNIIPERMITACFGGFGFTEIDPYWIERVPADIEARTLNPRTLCIVSLQPATTVWTRKPLIELATSGVRR